MSRILTSPSILVPLDDRAVKPKPVVKEIVTCPSCLELTISYLPECCRCGAAMPSDYPECPHCKRPTNLHDFECPIRPCRMCNRLRRDHVSADGEHGQRLLMCPTAFRPGTFDFAGDY